MGVNVKLGSAEKIGTSLTQDLIAKVNRNEHTQVSGLKDILGVDDEIAVLLGATCPQ